MGSGGDKLSKKTVTGSIICVNSDSSTEKNRQSCRTARPPVKSKASSGLDCAKAEALDPVHCTRYQNQAISESSSDCGVNDGRRLSSMCKEQEKGFIARWSTLSEERDTSKRAKRSPNSPRKDVFWLAKSSSIDDLHFVGGKPEEVGATVPKRKRVQASKTYERLKLQLFPIDELTHSGLQNDNYNPLLQLTLGARKKIASIIKHLSSKWGSSCIASGELMLYPYNVDLENHASCQRWTRDDTETSAADVYEIVGRPTIFCLRYGWFFNTKLRRLQESVESSSVKDHCQLSDVQQQCKDVESASEEKQPEPKLTTLTDIPDSKQTVPKLKHVQTSKSYERLKLQLFPIDELTRRGLQNDNYNPHQELTLGAQKKMASIIKHLSSKWGSSCIASGELMLYPYNVDLENHASCQRWTRDDTESSAADVYEIVGRPTIFCLRYGWFSDTRLRKLQESMESSSVKDHCHLSDVQQQCKDVESASEERQPPEEPKLTTLTDIPGSKEDRQKTIDQVVQVMDNQRIADAATLSIGSWADCLTNISLGSLFTDGNVNNSNPLDFKGNSQLRQIPFTCDSFDAAITAHLACQGMPTQIPQTSILDAEETCQAFPFQKIEISRAAIPYSQENAQSGASSENLVSYSTIAAAPSEMPRSLLTPENACQEDNKSNLQSNKKYEESIMNNPGVLDLSWSGSLGPFDLGHYSSTRHIISGDSISLSGLFGTSIDAFQNYSLLGKDGGVPIT